mmetsp:Transcript_51052/g.108458  ORF Transcript_51052/g.108458 Transcript_51052/m.108458 type:complete len:238 (-) Transcript_51052:5-718(-)
MLHRDHLQRCQVVAVVGGACAIREHQAFVAAVVRLSHRGVNADVRGDATEDNVLDTLGAEDHVKIRGVEGALTRLVDDGLVGKRGELGDDVPTIFATHEDAAAGALVTNALAVGANLAGSPSLVGREVSQVRAVALTGVHDVVACFTHGVHDLSDGLDGLTSQGNVVAHFVHVATDATEVRLHVDDNQGGVLGLHVPIVGPAVARSAVRGWKGRPCLFCFWVEGASGERRVATTETR